MLFIEFYGGCVDEYSVVIYGFFDFYKIFTFLVVLEGILLGYLRYGN